MKLSDIPALLMQAADALPDNPDLRAKLCNMATHFLDDGLVVNLGDTTITLAAEDHFRVTASIESSRLEAAHLNIHLTSEGIITDAVDRSGEVMATSSVMYDDRESELL